MKTVIITGISRGIGKATAQKFLNENWNVIGLSTTGIFPNKHENLKVYRTDLSDHLSIIKFAEAVEKIKKFDILINNAGISIDKSRTISIDILRKTLEVNLIGLIDLTENLVSYINNSGHIINLSSGLGSIHDATNSYSPAYRISKSAINMYTRVLANRLSEKNITVSSIDPGWVKTDMGGAGATRDPNEAAEDIFKLAVSNNESGFFWYRGMKKQW